MLDNAFGSGSFLVAAALERRKFIGIEKNKEVHLFKEQQIDYIKLARQRLSVVEQGFGKKHLPAALSSPVNGISFSRRGMGMVDVNALIPGDTTTVL